MEFLKFKTSAEFLQAARFAHRSSAKPLSIRQLSQKLGYASDRGLGMALKGQRAISGEMQARLIRYLKLTAKEQLYLQTLIRRERHPDLVPNAQASLPSTPPSKEKLVEGKQLHPLIPAYSLAVLELLRLAKEPLSAKTLRARLRAKVELSDLKRCLDQLVAAGLIGRNSKGCFRELEEHEYITSSLDIPSQIIRQIHRSQLAHTATTLEDQMLSEREFIANTFTIPTEKLPEIKRILREKFDELVEEIAGGTDLDDSTVVQLNLQFYLQSRS